MEGTRTEINSSYDPEGITPMQSLINKYKVLLDKEMDIVIGKSDQDMPFSSPESLLTNLTSDVMKEEGDKYTNGHCDLALMNVNGHRTGLPKGDITIGNIFNIYSFDNVLVLVKVKGSVLKEIFDSYAKMGGAGLSSSAKLEISKNGQLISAAVNNSPLLPDKEYTLVTLDYLAEGNDGMGALSKADSVEDMGILLRDVMLNYVEKKTSEGQSVSSVLDGRITVK